MKKVDLPITTPNGVASVDFADPRLTAEHRSTSSTSTPATAPGARSTLYTDVNQDGKLDAGDQEVSGSTQAADGGPDNNTATWNGLAWGQDYLVEESTPPPGYNTDLSAVNGAKLVLTKADANGTKTVDFFDPRARAAQNPGTITVFKNDGYSGDAVDGATFQLYLDVNGDGTPQDSELRSATPRESTRAPTSGRWSPVSTSSRRQRHRPAPHRPGQGHRRRSGTATTRR